MYKKILFLLFSFFIFWMTSILQVNAILVGNTNQATFSLSPQTGTYNVNDSFEIGIYVNTNNQDTDTVAAYLVYDKTHFEALSIDVSNSAYSMQAENIIDSTNGKIKITRGVTYPSKINNTNALVAKINFKALSGINPISDNLTFDFVAGDANRSNVFLAGNPILSGVYNAKYTVSGSDTTPPTISSVSASSITSSGATITWTTDESSDSQVEYGLTTAYGSQTTLNSAFVTSHSQSISGLSPSTTYHYRVKSKDAAGNAATSGDNTFTTSAVSSNLSVTISASPSSGQVPLNGVDLTAVVSGGSGNINYTFYCNRSDSGTNITTPNDGKFDNQSVTTYTAANICNYSSAGTYTAKVIVERGGSQAEAHMTITVTATNDTTPPTISSVQASSVTYNSAIISWTTNEAADSLVEYGPSSNYNLQTPLNNSLTTSHSLILSGLSPNTTYHFRATSADASSNLAYSGDNTFTTQSQPSLSASLSANPSSGTAPLNDIDLTATVSGSISGNTNYTFYCNRSDISTNITTPYQAKYDNQGQTTFTAPDVCSYSQAGTYTAKVIAENGGIQAEARVSIVVNTSYVPPPSPTPTPKPSTTPKRIKPTPTPAPAPSTVQPTATTTATSSEPYIPSKTTVFMVMIIVSLFIMAILLR